MANHTLTLDYTCLLNAGRVRNAHTSQGDMWECLGGNIADGAYNATADLFNSLQSQVHTWISGGDTVTGTTEGGTQNIDDDPGRKVIIHRPGS